MTKEWRGDTVTFAITLPVCGLFEDHIEALRRARDEAHRRHDLPVAQALHTILVLAERGHLAINTDTGQPFVLPRASA